MSRRVLVAAVGIAALVGTTSAADAGKVSPHTDALDLLVPGGKPARIELRVTIDGQSVPAVWDETFAKMLAFYDRDGDGVLDRTEAARLPSPFALRQVLWGQIIPQTGDAPAFADLDLNADGKVNGEELADYYRRAGLGCVLVGVGRPTDTDRLTDALLKHLDANKDGRVDEAEWKAVAETLRKLDKNDDELIGPGELVDKTVYPGATGAILCSAPSPADKSEPTIDALPFVVLPIRTADTHWISVVNDRREKAHAPAIQPAALTALRTDVPAAAWVVNLGTRTKDLAPLQMVGKEPPANARLRFAADGVRLELRTDEGKLKEQTAAARKRFTALFAECDTDSDGKLDGKELGTPKAGPFRQMAALADRDADGCLSAKELTAWLDLQEQIAKGHVLLTVLDHGAGLFEFLDADHDGSLSVRELRTAWARLKDAGCVTEKGFDRTKLPRQLLAAISHGHPRAAIGKPVRTGPAWFLAMDRNGDGDISTKEWVGDLDVFRKLDADGDGLLSAAEAEKAPVPK
jgi:Ca2+-binding EF-hand superfamily protein